MRADADANPAQEPAQVFDNLYFVGGRQVVAWAINTDEGIVLIDAMNNSEEGETVVAVGLRAVSLDPDDIVDIFIA